MTFLHQHLHKEHYKCHIYLYKCMARTISASKTTRVCKSTLTGNTFCVMLCNVFRPALVLQKVNGNHANVGRVTADSFPALHTSANAEANAKKKAMKGSLAAPRRQFAAMSTTASQTPQASWVGGNRMAQVHVLQHGGFEQLREKYKSLANHVVDNCHGKVVKSCRFLNSSLESQQDSF